MLQEFHQITSYRVTVNDTLWGETKMETFVYQDVPCSFRFSWSVDQWDQARVEDENTVQVSVKGNYPDFEVWDKISLFDTIRSKTVWDYEVKTVDVFVQGRDTDNTYLRAKRIYG